MASTKERSLVVDVVRCQTNHSGHAVPMPSRQCVEEGCTRPVLTRDRCSAHYQSWRKSPDFTFLPRVEYRPPVDPVCPWCGPYERPMGQGSIICPTCDLDPGEHAYIDRIIADSSAVLAEEVREFNARRAKGGS
jgi:hypothetical protein